jgi:hypothetical protein
MEKVLYDIIKLTQGQLHEYLYDYLIKKGYEPQEEISRDLAHPQNRYIYAPGDIPVLLVAHLDTVHREIPTEIFFDAEHRVMWSPQGIGGDDRAGVYGILKVLEHCKPHVIFLHDEEVGGVGARVAAYGLDIPNVNFMIEFDRRGNKDAVFYDCGNEDFQQHILDFGFELNYGSFSDISILAPIWDLAAVNLSIGYFNEHTRYEYINLNYLDETVEKTIKIIKESDPNVLYDYQEIYYPPYRQTTLLEGENFQEDDIMTLEEFYQIFGRPTGEEQ